MRKSAVAALLVLVPAFGQQRIAFTNISPQTAPGLFSSLSRSGFSASAITSEGPLGGDLIIWEARQDSLGELTVERARELGEFVRQGHSLLVVLSPAPGTSAMRLGFLLPTNAWGTQVRKAPALIAAAEWDASLFPHDEPKGLVLPYSFEIRPVSAIERGQQRQEHFAQTIPYIKESVPAGGHFWTRPLLNRAWRVRITGNDVAQSPLLVTGEYGAGRVAVFAASPVAPNNQLGTAVYEQLFQWLAAAHPATAPEPRIAITASVRAKTGRAVVHLQSPTSQPLPLQVLLRILTPDHAFSNDVEGSVTLQPGQPADLEFPLPAPSPTGYQALSANNIADIRLGVLSATGATLLLEQRISLDLRPPLKLSIATDDLRSIKYPFHAPGPETPLLANRMGTAITEYAYLPGAIVHANAILSNGVRNLAPAARTSDETQPNNPSLPAINDQSMYFEKTPIDGVQGFGTWVGKAGVDNTIVFKLPDQTTVNRVVLVGSAENMRNGLAHNPGAVIVETDTGKAAESFDLDTQFPAAKGRVVLQFPAVKTQMIRVRLPWITIAAASKRLAPWLGEIEIEGWTGQEPLTTAGTLGIALMDALSGRTLPLLNQPLELAPGATANTPVTFTLPPADGKPHFYRVEAKFTPRASSPVTAETPLLVLESPHGLAPLSDVRPPTAAELGFIVTRGFRNVFPDGPGTAETGPSWAQPDDLIWAYSRQMKQIPANARTQANRLYVTESDLRHYSTPWRAFPNGELFYDLGTPFLVDNMKHRPGWDKSDTVVFGHSDRWDTGPQISMLHAWQDFVEFDEHLRELGLPPLDAKTRIEVATEIHTRYEDEWQSWQLARYLHSVRELRDAFTKEGKTLLISAQGIPMVAGEPGVELSRTIGGMSDDSTWGMMENSVPLTTGRQLAELAFNPVWRMSTLVQWGYNSSTLNNPQWHVPAGTTEPSRRHIYDRAWRGTISPEGTYRSVYTYGFNSNAGLSLTMTENDWRQWWLLTERQSLIAPEAPLGAGLIISTSSLSDPKHIRFTGVADVQDVQASRAVEYAFRRLHEAGMSIPFATNVSALANWRGDAPLIILDPDQFSEPEIAILKQLKTAGIRMAAIGASPLPSSAQGLFTYFLQRPPENLTPAEAAAFAARFALPLTFPAGTAGYGFRMSGLQFIVVEDWQEQGRTVSVKLRATPGRNTAAACDVNEHTSLRVRREGDYWVIDTPLRPGDGTLVALEERS